MSEDLHNQVARKLRLDIKKAVDVNQDYHYLLRKQLIAEDQKERGNDTKQTEKEIEEFRRQTVNRWRSKESKYVGHDYSIRT
jgi:predicted Holliday junction resolvase-like endonuclease